MDSVVNHQPTETKVSEWKKWAYAFLLLNLADVLLTYYAVMILGAHELNPIMRVFTNWGLPAFSIAKATLIAFVLWGTYMAATKGKLWSLRIATFLYTGVIGWNIWALP